MNDFNWNEFYLLAEYLNLATPRVGDMTSYQREYPADMRLRMKSIRTI
jgi:hypothetical protein